MNHLKRFNGPPLPLAALFFSTCISCGESSSETQPSRIASDLQCSGEADLEPCEDTEDGSRLCEDLDASFVGAVLTSVNPDLDTAALSLPEPGRICMSGTLSAINAASWGAEMVLAVDRRTNEGKRIVATFDAEALGVAAVRFTVDPPPNARMTVMADVVTQCDCPDHPYSCVEGGRYTLATASGEEPVIITESETITASLKDFVPQSLTESLPGTHPLALFLLHLDPTDEAHDYEFCVSDVEFLDAEGDLVTPTD